MTPAPSKAQGPRNAAALLGGFCLFLSTIEYLIPKPLPFMRIGIANLPLMIALDIFPFSRFLFLTGIKIAGQALITGALFSSLFLFSLAGTSLSALTMYGLRRLLGPDRISFIGLGTAGALASNGVQLVLARFVVFGKGVQYIAPPFLAAGMIAGISLGLWCEHFTRRSRWYGERLKEARMKGPA